MMRQSLIFLVLLGGCGEQPMPAKAETPAVLHEDVVAYAMASCFAYQQNASLKDPGERWAGAIMQRAHGPAEKWTPVADAVKAELARSGIAQGQGEGPQSPAISLPVMTCGQIANLAAVRRSIETASKALAQDYRTGASR